MTDLSLSQTTVGPVTQSTAADSTNANSVLPRVMAVGSDGAALNKGIRLLGPDGNALLPAAAALADGLATPTTTQVGTMAMAWNGVSWDRWANNIQATLLANAARTVTTQCPVQVNANARGVHVELDVTVTATGGLTLQIVGSYGNGLLHILYNAVQVTGAGKYLYELYPGGVQAPTAGSEVTAAVARALPRSWLVQVVHADASSWTYSVAASLIV